MLAAKENRMRTPLILPVLAIGLSIAAGCGGGGSGKPDGPAPGDASGSTIDASPASSNFSFFITSTGNPSGGDFRRSAADTDGLAGADAFCQMKAAAAVPASAGRQWRAYLSTSTVNAKDRIGAGPWFNRSGTMIAASVAALHMPAMNQINKANGLDETGASIPGRGDTPNQHDIVTGSTAAGVSSGNTCNNWTSSAASGVTATVGHFDRMGVAGNIDPMSFVEAHPSQGCSADAFVPTGGRGSIYCFAAD
jgi:hypothetical protein